MLAPVDPVSQPSIRYTAGLQERKTPDMTSKVAAVCKDATWTQSPSAERSQPQCPVTATTLPATKSEMCFFLSSWSSMDQAK